MQRRLWIPGILFAALLATSACGGPTTAEATIGQGAAKLAITKPEAEIAGLVPANTDVLLYVKNPEELVQELETLTALFGEEMAGQFDPNQIFAQLGPVADEMDRTKPMAVAVAIPEGEKAEPISTMILPVKDAEKVKAIFAEQQQQEPTIENGYLIQAMGPPGMKVEGGPAAITKHVPKGDLVVRVDLGRLIERQGTNIHEQLDKALEKGTRETPPGMPDMGEMMKDAGQMLHDFVGSAEYLDLSVDVDDTNVHVAGLFTAKEGSKLAEAPAASADLVNMAGVIPEDFPVVVLATMDPKKYLEPLKKVMDGLFETFPEEMHADLRTMWTKSLELYEYVGDKSVMGFKWDEGGMAMVGAMELTDSKTYFEKWNAMLDENVGDLAGDMGMTIERLPPAKVAGYDAQVMRMTMDVAKMMETNPGLDGAPPEQIEAMEKMLEGLFGKDGWTWHVIDVSGVLVMAMGLGEDALAQAVQNAVAAKAPATGALADAISRAGGKPSFLVHLEMREFLRGTLAAVKNAMPPEQAAEVPEIEAGKPVNLMFYACGDGRYYAGGFSMDLGATKDLVELMGGRSGGRSVDMPPDFPDDMPDDMGD